VDWTEALEIVIERSRGGQRYGHERFRALCAEGHPDREIWRARMVETATGTPPLPSPEPRPAPSPEDAARVAEALRLTAALHACPYRSTVGCGCGGARCALKLATVARNGRTEIGRGGSVSHRDCYECIRAHGEPGPASMAGRPGDRAAVAGDRS
jgi:hypothetical protein